MTDEQIREELDWLVTQNPRIARRLVRARELAREVITERQAFWQSLPAQQAIDGIYAEVQRRLRA